MVAWFYCVTTFLYALFCSDIRHTTLQLEALRSGRIPHNVYSIYARNDPRLVRGYSGMGLSFNGINQYLETDSGIACNGDLSTCSKGLTFRFRINPAELRSNSYLLSGAPYDVYYKDGQLVAEMRTGRSLWRVSAPGLVRNRWQLIDLSWHPQQGLKMFLDGEMIAEQATPMINSAGVDDSRRFYIGRANGGMHGKRYLNAVLDDFQIWEANRAYLLSKRLLRQHGKFGETGYSLFWFR